MSHIEKKILTWAEKNMLIFAVLLVTLMSLVARYLMINNVSGDALHYLLPWYQKIKENGGFECLKLQVGDYNILYQTIIALFTYLPISALYAYKMLSIFFDYLLAGAMSYLVYINTDRNRMKAVIAYIVTILLPAVCINSASWAQCDSIFTFWAILALIFLCKEKYVPCFIAYGLSFAFKLQAVFFLPFFLFVYVYKKRFSIFYFLIVPAVMIVSCLGGILHGRSIKDVFLIYFNQTTTYRKMSLNYAGVWNFLQKADYELAYYNLRFLAIALTITILGIYMIVLLKKKKTFSNQFLIELAFLFAFTCVMFLPSMHERYDFPYVVLGVALILFDPRFIPAFLGISLVSLRMYSIFLFSAPEAGEGVTVANVVCYVLFAIFVMRDGLCREHIKKSENEIPNIEKK